MKQKPAKSAMNELGYLVSASDTRELILSY